VQQIIRPTGLLDPLITVKPATNQVDDALEEIRIETEKGGRVLVTTLTKKLSEDLAKYLTDIGVKAKYLHSDIDTLERVQILNELRRGLYDVLVGINLLREGLDLPEVSLVVILDADKEGFLRSETALTQTCGRASRNVRGRVIMYADKITNSIQRTIDVTHTRRKLQEAHNTEHGIIPQTVTRTATEELAQTFGEPILEETREEEAPLTAKELMRKIDDCDHEMKRAAKETRFEDAAHFRDLMRHYQKLLLLEENF